MEHSCGGDDEVGRVPLAVGRLDVPAAVPELQPADLRAVPDVLVDVVAAGDGLEVGQDLAARREDVAPLGVRRERVAVQVRGHVARDPGVGVLTPGAAETIRLLVDRDVGEAGLLQLDGAEDARHARTDDDDPWLTWH